MKFKDAKDFLTYKAGSLCSDIDQPDAVQIVEHLNARYFLKATANSQVSLQVLNDAGDLVPTTTGHMRQEADLTFNPDTVKKSEVFTTPKGEQFPHIFDALGYIQQDAYEPREHGIMLRNGRITLNKWVPSQVKPQNAHVVSETDLRIWREFLERWFPIEEEREFFEQWLAVTTMRPEIHVDMAPLIRSEQGVGKNFLMDQVIAPLSGVTNAKTTNLTQLVGDFSGDLFESTVILVDEVYANKKQTADRLKNKVTDRRARVNIKYQPQYEMPLFYNLLMFSNAEVPLYIEENDRRWWIPQFIKHRESRSETASFLTTEMLPWVTHDGLQILAKHFWDVAKETDFSIFNEAPLTPSKTAIEAVDLKPEYQDRLRDWLSENRQQHFHLTEITEQPFVKMKLSSREVTTIMREEGWENFRANVRGTRISKWRFSKQIPAPVHSGPSDVF